MFNQQVVLVTGAGRGLGAAYARLFAERGALVVVHDAGVDRAGRGHDSSVAQAVVNTIIAKDGRAVIATQDLSTREACEELIAHTLTEYGRLDALVHSAGIVFYKGIEQTTPQEWETLRRINIDAPFWLCRAAWSAMREQDYGRIVLTLSDYGLQTYEGSDVTAYGVGKAAQFGLMNMLAGEGKEHKILVNAICPVAATRIFRRKVSPNELTPEAVAPGVIFLASTACQFTGKVLHARDGQFALGQYQVLPAEDLAADLTPEAVRDAFQAESQT